MTISFKSMNLFEVDKIFLGSPDEQLRFQVDISIDEIIRYHHLEKVEVSQFVSYPKNQAYFLYGDKDNAYISNIMTKYPDFHQVCILRGMFRNRQMSIMESFAKIVDSF